MFGKTAGFFSKHWKNGKELMSGRGEQVLKKLKRLGRCSSLEGMKRFGIRTDRALGVSVPDLRKLAKAVGKDHRLAAELWKTRIHEARLLAAFIDDPAMVTERQMENWVRGFDSWDVCDLVCSDLFDRTPFAWRKAVEWSKREAEYVKRAGFVLMAALAVHDKAATDSAFREFFPIIRREAGDDRNFVKKAVNWALRNIGKRNRALNRAAIREAERIRRLDARAARWIAADALRELRSESVQRRLGGT